MSLMKGFRELTGAEVIHAYGASETTPVVSVNWQIKPELGELDEDAKLGPQALAGPAGGRCRGQSRRPDR